MSTAARLIASILAAGLLLAACGDDDDATSDNAGELQRRLRTPRSTASRARSKPRA